MDVRARRLRIVTLAGGSYAGLLGAHVLDYRLLGGSGARGARLLASTGHAYFGRALEFMIAALVVAAVTSFAFGYRRGSSAMTSSGWRRLALAFALMQSGGFLVLEAGERVAMHAVGPTIVGLMLAGLALQCVVAVVLATAVRLIARAGARVAAAVASARPRTRLARTVAVPPRRIVPRASLLEHCMPRRGPPSLVV